MGCGGSKMEVGAEAGEGLIRAVRRNVEEIRKRRMRRGAPLRKDSIVSTTGLLLPEEEDDTATTTTGEASHHGSSHCHHVCRHCGIPLPPREHGAGDTSDPPSTMTTLPPAAESDRAVWKLEEEERGKEADKEENEGEVEKQENNNKKKKDEENEAEEDGKIEKQANKEEEEEENEAEEEEKGKVEKQEIKEEEEEKEDDDKNKGLREEKAVEEDKEQVDANEEEKGGFDGAALNHGRTLQGAELQPGSPSFRVFFQEAVRESSDIDGSDKAGMTEAAGRSTDDVVKKHGRNDSVDSSTSQECGSKPSKKHKSKRFKVLPRGSSAVYGFLNVRTCCSAHHHRRRHSSDTDSASRENPSSVHT